MSKKPQTIKGEGTELPEIVDGEATVHTGIPMFRPEDSSGCVAIVDESRVAEFQAAGWKVKES